ncbi:hypothetical protein OQA88_5422 [Cercophora sp. LCS_1]
MSAHEPPLRVLSLDGGGIRGISSLLILENIMEQILQECGLESVPRPCEYFDFIGGTSTGGIIAIMLGRLGMTVDQCLKAYTDVAEQAFTRKKHKLPVSSTGIFSATALEEAIKKAVMKFCNHPNCVARRSQQEGPPANTPASETCPHSDLAFRDTACTKTAVLAITRENVDTRPTLFTTYDVSAKFHGCTIWQVARATSAATTFFKPAVVGRDRIKFVDAGFGYNNPCEVLVAEAEKQFPNRKGNLLVLSIGTGLGDVVKIRDNFPSIIRALKNMATSSKKVAARLDNQYGDSGKYYRFNVDKGLEDVTLSDWKEASAISAHTYNYLEENRRRVEMFVKSLVAEARTPEGHEQLLSSQPSGAVGHGTPKPCSYIPLPQNRRFTGRRGALDTIQRKLFIEKECQRVAVVGLGGVGKTQLALQLAYWAKTQYPSYSIFWVPALSNATFEQAYAEIARQLPTQNSQEDPRDAVCRHLSSGAGGPWFLIIDNADDMDLMLGPSHDGSGINRYIPISDVGLVLLTTRSREVAVPFAGGDIIDLHAMEPSEATDFLAKSLGPRRDLLESETDTKELLSALTYLPLAITQAAAYLSTNQIPTREYLELLRSTNQGTANLLSQEFYDNTRYPGSQNAVATTWLVSFEQIRKSNADAAKVLSFLACIEPKAIPRSILPRLDPERLTRAIGTLCGYAFLSRRGTTDTFDMHSLVHLATQIWIKRDGRTASNTVDAIKHLREIFPEQEWENRDLWREYYPHAFILLQQRKEISLKERFHLLRLCGQWLEFDGRIAEAVQRLEQASDWADGHLPEDHPNRLASQHELAGAYLQDGQVEKAITLLEQVVAIRIKVLAETHPNRLASQHQLAGAYLQDGQVEKAITLLEQVVAIRIKVEKAIALQEQVVAIQIKVLAETHPNRLASQHQLAGAYLQDGQVEKAIALLEQVVAIEAKTLVKTHPNRLASQHELARAYLQDGQVEKAIALLEQVVAIEAKTLAETHPNRLASQHQLAGAYLQDGQVEKAIALLEQVVAIQIKVLAETHPNRLASQHELAVAYWENGQADEATTLMKKVVAIRTEVLAETHPHRLASESWLRGMMQETGQAV